MFLNLGNKNNQGLKNLSDKAIESSNGNLDVIIESNSKDEIGQLSAEENTESSEELTTQAETLDDMLKIF